ncbi:hypothetical protein PISMIDRAFT_119622 [Pisolithus microcarpus 441]|uniref:Uncharacterized protein n=1 Tax=Pisolithus microcarpus 441 TaxID=765257 RepID=A0A0C9Y833_9AGAM|nr:hypothetical protein PISMIDRAFT_119622 [Pisolithus microcarpus 441]
MASIADEESTTRCICSCSKYNFGKPHTVSLATWYCHIDEAKTETEKQCIHSTRVHQATPHLTRPNVSVRGRAAIIQAMAKRCIEMVEDDILPHMPDLPDPALDNGVSCFALTFLHTNVKLFLKDNRPCRPDCQSPGDHGNTPFPFSFEYECRACPSIDIEALAELAILPLMQHNMQFILALKNMSLKDPASKLTSKAIEKIQNPPSHADPINDPGTHFSTSTYLALENASQLAYNRVCQAAQCHTPKFDCILTFHNIEKSIPSYTRVISIEHDMCHNTCMAFTGPFSQLEACPTCNMSCWKQERLQGTHRRSRVAAQTFTTIPISPQLQALYWHKDSTTDMDYLCTCTMEVLQHLQETGDIPIIDDVMMVWDYLGTMLDGDIKQQDIVLMVSIDGTQLYDSKESNCWMYVWIIINLLPDKHYHKLPVQPGGFIPGPNKPKHLDSFLFLGLHHLSALQAEGLPIWNARTNLWYLSYLYLIFTTADGPGLVYWNGMVGHSGKNSCCMYCGVLSRHKMHKKHYYPALLRPCDCCAPGSDHNNIDVFNLLLGGSTKYANNLNAIVSVRNKTQWGKMKTDTGLTKPPLLLALQPT